MKIFLLLVICSCFLLNLKAQNVGIGTNTPNPNAALDISSSNKGVLIPRLSTTARNSMTNVAKGMLVYDTSASGFYYHDGGKWFPISQPNTDSLLRYTYAGVAPSISSMPLNSTLETTDLFGTLYDNGGQAGNYGNNSDGKFVITGYFGDSVILIKVEVVQMNLESPYDSLEIYSPEDYEHKQVFTGNRTGTFYFKSDDILEFRFRSNGVNNLSGFKINWTKITSNSLKVEIPPLSGWYFNSAKLAARAGANINNNWATDSLGYYSFAFGQNAVAKGNHSFTFGNNSYSLYDNSIAIGNDNNLKNFYSTAIGSQNEVKGQSSSAIGALNRISGSYSSAIGVANEVSGSWGAAIGESNEVSGVSANAMGSFNKVRGNSSTAIGSSLIVNRDNSFAAGSYNDTTNMNAIFMVGNGLSNTSRRNALTISNANVGIDNTFPQVKLDVNGGIRTKYSGSAILNVTGTGSAALVYVPITTLPVGWDYTNTLVLVSVADGISGVIYRTKLVTTSAIELVFEANATGPTRFNYIVFKL